MRSPPSGTAYAPRTCNLDCTDPATTGEMVLGALVPGDVLLVKASRAVAAEAVLDYIKAKIKG